MAYSLNSQEAIAKFDGEGHELEESAFIYGLAKDIFFETAGDPLKSLCGKTFTTQEQAVAHMLENCPGCDFYVTALFEEGAGSFGN